MRVLQPAAAPSGPWPRTGGYDNHQTRNCGPAQDLAPAGSGGPHQRRCSPGHRACASAPGQQTRGPRRGRRLRRGGAGCSVISAGSGFRWPSRLSRRPWRPSRPCCAGCSRLAAPASAPGPCWPPPTRPTRCRSRYPWPDPSWARPLPSVASAGRARMPRWPAGRCWPAAWSPRPRRPSSWSAAGCLPATSWSQRSLCPAACSPWRPWPCWERPRADRGCAAPWNGPRPGRYGTGRRCFAGPPTIPARSSGPGLSG